MEEQQFDELARRLAGPLSRQQLIKVAIASALGGAFFHPRSGHAQSPITDNCGRFCNQLPPGPQRGSCLYLALQGKGPCYDCGPKGTNTGWCYNRDAGYFCCPNLELCSRCPDTTHLCCPKGSHCIASTFTPFEPPNNVCCTEKGICPRGDGTVRCCSITNASGVCATCPDGTHMCCLEGEQCRILNGGQYVCCAPTDQVVTCPGGGQTCCPRGEVCLSSSGTAGVPCCPAESACPSDVPGLLKCCGQHPEDRGPKCCAAVTGEEGLCCRDTEQCCLSPYGTNVTCCPRGYYCQPDGTCCGPFGAHCNKNNDCCSGICAGDKTCCDSASQLCPSSGGRRSVCCGPGTACCPSAKGGKAECCNQNQLCQQNKCCNKDGTSCTSGGDCCSNVCINGTCCGTTSLCTSADQSVTVCCGSGTTCCPGTSTAACCSSSETCQSGTCQPNCVQQGGSCTKTSQCCSSPTALTCCGTTCTDTQTNNGNCGSCGTACTVAGTTCQGGQCLCPNGQPPQNGTCTACSPTTCPNGCCDSNGSCVPTSQQTASLCGTGGAACVTCQPGTICNNGICGGCGHCRTLQNGVCVLCQQANLCCDDTGVCIPQAQCPDGCCVGGNCGCPTCQTCQNGQCLCANGQPPQNGVCPCVGDNGTCTQNCDCCSQICVGQGFPGAVCCPQGSACISADGTQRICCYDFRNLRSLTCCGSDTGYPACCDPSTQTCCPGQAGFCCDNATQLCQNGTCCTATGQSCFQLGCCAHNTCVNSVCCPDASVCPSGGGPNSRCCDPPDFYGQCMPELGPGKCAFTCDPTKGCNCGSCYSGSGDCYQTTEGVHVCASTATFLTCTSSSQCIGGQVCVVDPGKPNTCRSTCAQCRAP